MGGVEALTAAFDVEIDLRSLDVPILSVDGEYARPYSKTHRLWREARTFQNVVLADCDHLAACGFGDSRPTATGFINMYDAV